MIIGLCQEYIDGILDASFWCSPQYLRNLFAMLLLSGSLSRPEIIWERTWKELSDDILNRQRVILQNKGITFYLLFFLHYIK